MEPCRGVSPSDTNSAGGKRAIDNVGNRVDGHDISPEGRRAWPSHISIGIYPECYTVSVYDRRRRARQLSGGCFNSPSQISPYNIHGSYTQRIRSRGNNGGSPDGSADFPGQSIGSATMPRQYTDGVPTGVVNTHDGGVAGLVNQQRRQNPDRGANGQEYYQTPVITKQFLQKGPQRQVVINHGI